MLGLVLDKQNNDKYLKYFNIGYEETAKQYQSKIDREKNNIHQIIERIKILKNDDSLDWLDQVLLDAIQNNVTLNSICATVNELSSIDECQCHFH